MPSFSKTSQERKATCCMELQLIADDAIEVIDFSFIEGARDKDTQDRYYRTGVSTVQWPNSKHNITEDQPLSLAMDLWPYIPGFGALSGHPDQVKEIMAKTGRSKAEVNSFIRKAFAKLAGVVIACAHGRGYKIRWGGDWNGNGNMLDQRFHDLPHFEYAGTR